MLSKVDAFGIYPNAGDDLTIDISVSNVLLRRISCDGEWSDNTKRQVVCACLLCQKRVLYFPLSRLKNKGLFKAKAKAHTLCPCGLALFKIFNCRWNRRNHSDKLVVGGFAPAVMYGEGNRIQRHVPCPMRSTRLIARSTREEVVPFFATAG